MPDNTPFLTHCAAVRRRLDAAGMRRAGGGSVSWKINKEVVVTAGWGRAILLQFAHPLVAAGVAEHSTFRRGPLAPVARLTATVRAMLSLTFGDDDEAIAAAARISVIHDRVSGRLGAGAGVWEEGVPYSAHQPELLRWVHATLLESVPLVYDRLVGPLTAAEGDRYCAESAVVEPLLGIPPGLLPRQRADLDSYIARMMAGREIAVTDTARRLARAVLYPPYSGLAWPLFRPLRLITIGLLPPPLRAAYHFPWGAREERALARWVRLLRTSRRLLPAAAREWPSARRAIHRHGRATEEDQQGGAANASV